MSGVFLRVRLGCFELRRPLPLILDLFLINNRAADLTFYSLDYLKLLKLPSEGHIHLLCESCRLPNKSLPMRLLPKKSLVLSMWLRIVMVMPALT